MKSTISRRAVAGLTAFALYAASIFAPALETRALASQNQLLSPTTGTVGGLQLTNNYNAALDSLNTANSGGTAPTNQLSGSASLGNWWLNTTSAPYPYGMNDGTANWPSIGSLDPTAHAWNLQIGGGAATLASASTVDLCSTPRNYLTISGTTTINSFGSTCPAGVVKLVTFSAVTTLTYNSGSMIIPGGASVLTAPGDQATLVSLGGGNFQVANYTPANGSALINPSVDVGTYQLTAAVNVPSSKYLLAYGQAISRTTYATFLSVSTITQSVTRTNGSPTLTGFSDTTQMRAGAPIEGSGIPSGATVGSTTTTTVTMASTCSGGAGACNASSSGTANVTVFPNGNGDGSTTFNLPNCADVMLAGRGNMSGTPRGVLTSTYVGANPDALGVFGGAQSHTLGLGEIPSGIASENASQNISVGPLGTGGANTVPVRGGWGGYAPTVSTGSLYVPYAVSAGSFTADFHGANDITVTSTNTGGGAHSIVPPILTANCMIRVLAMLDAPSFPASVGANDNGLPIVADRRRAIG